jgi:hypothetical protein
MKKNVLIDCSTIRAGGGIQVSISFLKKLIDKKIAKNFSLYISRELSLACNQQKVKVSNFKEVKIRKLYYHLSVFINFTWYRKFEIVFCVFGPAYFLVKPKKLICGFARTQFFYPTIYWKNYKYNNFYEILKKKIHLFLFKFADVLIVEAKHVKKKFLVITKYKKIIYIVNNCLSDDFLSGKKKININLKKFDFKLLYVGSNYPHKNLNILNNSLNYASEILKKKIGIFFTLSDIDFNKLNNELKEKSINLGYVEPKKLKNLYSQIDAVIFPSLAESFSITPIEAMYCMKPLLASNKDFIKEFCHKIPYYFNPGSSKSIGLAIVKCLKKQNKNINRLIQGKKISNKFTNDDLRTSTYLKIINDFI